MKKSSAVKARPPRRIPLDHVQVDVRHLFSRLTEAACHFGLTAVGKFDSIGDAVGALFGSIEAVKLDAPVEVRLWRLVFRSISTAIKDILDELLQSNRAWSGDVTHVLDTAEIKIRQSDLEITADFFKNPASLPIVNTIKSHFRGWLGGLGSPAPKLAPL
jgi:hypothetical protein